MGNYDISPKTSVRIFFLAFSCSSYFNLIWMSLNWLVRTAVIKATSGSFCCKQEVFSHYLLAPSMLFGKCTVQRSQFSGFRCRNSNDDSSLPVRCICREPWHPREDSRDLGSKDTSRTARPTSDLEEEETSAAGREPHAGASATPSKVCRAAGKFVHEAIQPSLLQDLCFSFYFLKQVGKLTRTFVKVWWLCINGCKFNWTR